MLVGLSSETRLALPLLPFALLSGWLAWVGVRTPVPDDATEGEDAVAVILAFPLALLFSSAPYLTHGLTPLDAIFEGMSGVTGTGLTRYTAIDAQPFALHFLRAWQQFVGGYAIITLVVALLPASAAAAQQMSKPDVADDAGRDGRQTPNLGIRSRRVLIAYVVLTALCVLFVRLTGQSWSFSLLHGLTAVSTAGFSSLQSSLTDVPPAAIAILTLFAVLGAVALSDYVRPLTERAGGRKLVGSLAAIASLSLVFGLGAYAFERAAGAQSTLFDVLQVAGSAQTTTGFSALSVPDMTNGSKWLLIASMSIGGDLGSTAGGVKLMRLFTLSLALYALFRPRARRPGTPGGGPKEALKVVGAWTLLTLAGGAVLTLVGHAPVNAFFEAASALNNTGLTAGPSSGEDVPVVTRVVLILLMWIGRAEILAIALVLRAMSARDEGEDQEDA